MQETFFAYSLNRRAASEWPSILLTHLSSDIAHSLSWAGLSRKMFGWISLHLSTKTIIQFCRWSYFISYVYFLSVNLLFDHCFPKSHTGNTPPVCKEVFPFLISFSCSHPVLSVCRASVYVFAKIGKDEKSAFAEIRNSVREVHLQATEIG